MTRRNQVQEWRENGGFLKAGLAQLIKLAVELGIAFVAATIFVTAVCLLLVPQSITASSITVGPGLFGVTADQPTVPRWIFISLGSLWMGKWIGDKCYCELV